MRGEILMQYRNFGAHICCASNGVMNVEYVKKMIDCLSKMGYTMLEIGIDDIYKIEGEPYFGYLRGGYSAEEIHEMDEYAKSKGIELVPQIQTLAHLTNLVKIPHYSDIVDIDDVLLVDEPKTYELIEKMFRAISSYFTTRKVNIGFDEAFKVGLGKYLEKHGYTNRFEILLRHLNRVVEIANKYNITIIMWSDMFFRLANNGEYYGKGVRLSKDIIEKVPKNVELCYWDYYSEEEEHYHEMIESHEEFNNELWFAGGAWTWNGFAPHNGFSIKSMLPAMKQVREHGVNNVLITMWGDDGHDCSYFSVLPSLYAIRRFADGMYEMDTIKREFKELFDVEFDDFMLLDIPDKNSKNPDADKTDNACKVLLYNDCFLGLKDLALSEVEHIPFGEYAEELKKVSTRMGEFSYLFDNLAALCDVLEIKAELGIRTRKAYQEEDKQELQRLICDYRESIHRVGEFRRTLRNVWMKENKPYGWDIQEMRLGGLKARLQDCSERLQEYLDGKVKNIPELEEELLPYSPWGSQFNKFCGFATVSQL